MNIISPKVDMEGPHVYNSDGHTCNEVQSGDVNIHHWSYIISGEIHSVSCMYFVAHQTSTITSFHTCNYVYPCILIYFPAVEWKVEFKYIVLLLESKTACIHDNIG